MKLMSKLLPELQGKRKIAIGGHIRPDGDCVGSTMALYNYLIENYKDIDVTVYLEDFKEEFNFISGIDKIKKNEEFDIEYDLFIALDCGDKERLGEFLKYFENAKRTICIDHHITNTGFGNICILDPKASSTCEILYKELDKNKISKAVAEALYMGIVHDTGVFKYSNVSQTTMEIVGELVEKGINTSKIIDDTYYIKTYIQNQLLGRALLESFMILDRKCICSVLRKKMMDFYEAKPSDVDGIVEQLRLTKGIECAILIYEIENCMFKVSMRASSDKVDVSEICANFNGGGHRRAAGCTMQGSIHDVINNLTLHIEKQLNEK